MSTKPSVGERSAFPDSNLTTFPGMTYRQWLIGHIAGHSAGSANPWECNDDGMEQLAKFTIRFADAIIERLNKENGGQ